MSYSLGGDAMTNQEFQKAVLSRLDSIGSRLDTLEGRVGRLEQRMDRVDERMGLIESGLRDLREDQNAIRVVLVRHLADQTSLAERVAKLEEKREIDLPRRR